MNDETLVMFGGELKFMENGHLGGYLVRFSGPRDPDLTGDFFTKDTDFDIQAGTKTPVYFHHRMPLKTRDGQEIVIKKRIGDATLSVDGEGVLIDAILYNREQYEKDIAKAHKSLGWSSGTAAHLVDREQAGKAYWIKSWPLGLDASLTPTPAEPRNKAVSLKSLLDVIAPEQPAENGSTVSPLPGGATDQPTPDTKGLTEMEAAEVQKLVTDSVNAALKVRDDAQAAEVTAKAARQKEIQDAVAEERKKWEAEVKKSRRGGYAIGAGPAHNRTERGDTFAGALKAWVRTGDKGGFSADNFEENDEGQELLVITPTEAEEQSIKAMQLGRSLKASNATDMNIGTAADGGNWVPTGFYPQVIARRDETMLRDRLGVRMIPGVGTTVDVPVDNEADGEFVSKSEAQDSDLDAPAVDKKSMTLVTYTKYTDVSYELLDDTPVALEAFLADFVGRGMAKTHNSLLLTEVASGGTSLKTFSSASAIAAGEIEGIISNDDLSAYLEDDSSIAFVMRSSTLWAIKAILGDPRVYGDGAGNGGRNLLGYPVLYSQKAAAVAASAKPIYFGNWRYVGNREAPGLTFLRDPYTVGIKRQVRLLWHFRTVYKTLQGEAIGYAVHPSA